MKLLPRLCAIAALALAGTAFAQTTPQIAPPRTLDELKAETQRRADHNLYPVLGLRSADAQEALAAIDSLDRDAWAAAWSRIGDRYMTAAGKTRGKPAEEAFLMAWRYYSFARWPVPNSPGKEKAYRQALTAFRAYARMLDPPLEILRIPFEGKEIVGYLRLPKQARPVPLVLTISALDTRKEDMLLEGAAFLAKGIGVFAVDMPGTGEAPIKIDVGAERMFSAVLDALAKRPEIDRNRIVVRGVSWSGYWAAKLGIVEAARLKGAVVQGGPADFYFSADWQGKALGTREYLFDLFPARASVYGVATLDEFLAYGPRMSLKEEGLIDKPSAPMLLINGEKDSQVPIVDLDILLHHGSPKEAWVNPAGFHTGGSAEFPGDRIFETVVLPWIVRHATAK
ncbi:MAG: yellowish-green 1-like protein [Rhodospirillales bacterium]|nr:yellowish-green 1-like protein [Rhodospirillales bacterium]